MILIKMVLWEYHFVVRKMAQVPFMKTLMSVHFVYFSIDL